tara:strand:- start:26 stop:544 length:519 start_codon:yes stop_codon:yes gene_type:complete
MRKLLFVLTILFIASPLQAQSHIKRLSKKFRFFMTSEVDKVTSMTVVKPTDDPLGFQSILTFELSMYGFKTKSQSVAKRRLLEIENNVSNNSQNIAINDGALILKSDLALTFNYTYKGGYNPNVKVISSLTVEIVNLRTGDVVGGARWGGSSYTAEVLAQTLAYTLGTNLSK